MAKKRSSPATQLARAPRGYTGFLRQLKHRIRTSRFRAAVAVNRELIGLYWSIGRDILARQREQGWGAKVIDRLSADLRRAFPDMKGFSARNLKYMRAFAEAWPDEQFVQQAAAQIPWFHNCVLLDKVKDPSERFWYVGRTLEAGWSRAVLEHQIGTGLYRRQGKAQTNFATTLPAPQSDLAQELTKDPYNFDFLMLRDDARERDLERAVTGPLRNFLLELGVGFSFVCSQYPLKVGEDDFYLDLLFYHLKLRCYVVIDLKMKEFQPEFAGKMNFYLTAIDELLRHPDDQPSIGIILCKSRQNRLVVEYALRDMAKPIGVAKYRLLEALPDQLKGSLPTLDELEAEFGSQSLG